LGGSTEDTHTQTDRQRGEREMERERERERAHGGGTCIHAPENLQIEDTPEPKRERKETSNTHMPGVTHFGLMYGRLMPPAL
jgi:hypothetical protein